MPLSRAKPKPSALQASPERRAAPLLADVRGLIQGARRQAAQAVNASLALLCWNIGRRIRRDILREKRAEYGEAVLQSL